MNCKFLLSTTLISVSMFATAQQQTTAYAITGKSDNRFYWADIKQVDLTTGKVIKTLFEADKTKYTLSFTDKTASNNSNIQPTGYGAAACA